MTRKFLPLLILAIFSNCTAQDNTGYTKDAVLIGGLDSLLRASAIETSKRKECNLFGRVHIDYVVTELGSTSKIKVAKGLCAEADSIAIGIVKRMKYIPASRNGMPIRVGKSMPIYFKKED